MSVMPEPSSQVRIERGSAPVGARDPLRCSGCGYGIASYGSLPACPMCRETSWEPASRRLAGGRV